MSDNRKREILEMLETGKINAEEAARLLSEANAEPAESPAQKEVSTAEPVKAIAEDKRSMFRVRVRNLDTGQNKVTVNIPLRMLKFGLKLGGRFSPELEGFDFNELDEMISMGEAGMLVEVQNEESNEHVQVYID